MKLLNSYGANTNIGTFLDTVNVHGINSIVPPNDSLEALAKQALGIVSRQSDLTQGQLSEILSLPSEVSASVIEYLDKMGLIVKQGEGLSTTVELSDFAKDALKVFTVA